MQKFFLVIGKEKLYLYVCQGERCEKQYIEGNPDFSYHINHVSNDIKRLFQSLMNEYNLQSEAELQFTVINNEDFIYSEAVNQALGQKVVKNWDLEEVMVSAIQKMNSDKSLLIDEFGANFDGKNYIMRAGKLEKTEFNLLGYLLKEDDLLKFFV